jgi:hypothetical protein
MKSTTQTKQPILVGTASWSDPGFVEHWYPKKMPAGERLAWYAQHFGEADGEDREGDDRTIPARDRDPAR